MGMQIPKFQGCIGLINGSLIKIQKPWNNAAHGLWFNGQKKMCFMNSMVVVDHHGLFIYLEVGYQCSFHDVTILHESHLYKNQLQFFVHTNEYFEYVLGDLGHLGEEIFVMHQLGRCEHALGHDQNTVNVYDNMHVGYNVKVEWGIGELKQK